MLLSLNRPPDKNAFENIIFISKPKLHMLWVLKRCVLVKKPDCYSDKD